MERIQVEVVVVGAGFAGMTAATRAQELGARVALLEKTAEAPSWSNSRLSGGSYKVAGLSPLAPPGAIAAKLLGEIEEAGRADLVETWARTSARAYFWLRARGARFVSLDHGLVLAPVRPNRCGLTWRGRGPDATLRTLFARFLQLGGLYRGQTRAVELLEQDGRVAGVRAETADPRARVEFAGRAVILADGGFQADPALLREHAGVHSPEFLLQRGAGTGSGDGLRLALARGAALSNGVAIYGYLLHRDALRDPGLSHFPILDPLAASAVVVGPEGRRLVDEGLGGLAMVNRLARLPDIHNLWVVFDRHTWETAGRASRVVPPNPNLLLAGARLERAETAEELGHRLGVPAEALAATLSAFNDAAARDRLQDLPVPRTGSPAALRPPFFAAPLVIAVSYTQGGPLIDGRARVVDTRGRGIPGLYAAGTTTGGHSGGPRPASAGGISVAVTLGLMAAEDAVADNAVAS